MLKFRAEENSGVMVIAFEPTDDSAADWQSTNRHSAVQAGRDEGGRPLRDRPGLT